MCATQFVKNRHKIPTLLNLSREQMGVYFAIFTFLPVEMFDNEKWKKKQSPLRRN